MLTKQIAHIRKPTAYNGTFTTTPTVLGIDRPTGIRIPNRDVVIGKLVYSVPMNISRNNARNLWIVSLEGRPFRFYDDRHNESPMLSLEVAYDWMLENIHKDPATIPARPRAENRSKNIQFGISGISAMWKPLVGDYILIFRLQVYVNYKRKAFTLQLRKADLTQDVVERIVGQLAYMKHVYEVNSTFNAAELDYVWKRIASGTYSTPLPYPVPDHTMIEISENLFMRSKVWSGKGYIQPHNNTYVR